MNTAAQPVSARAGGSLVRQAMDAVVDHIRAHGLRVGDVVPGEAHFAAELQVSRAVMREAFGALSALTRIEVVNGRKPRVAAIDGSVMAAALDHAVATAQVTVPQVWEVRRTIEVRTAALAAANRTREEAERLVEIAAAMARDADDLAVMTAHDLAFHKAIAAASHNELFSQIVAAFGPLMQVAIPTAWRTRAARDQRDVMLDRHRDVARAIARRDPEAAAAAMEAHFDAAVGDLLASS
jgi:DNA-binding FadR family transcriptional regulator